MKKAVNEVLYAIYHNEIPEFLRDFCDTKEMRRIQEVGMNCGLEYTKFEEYSHLEPYSRYDHSLGVALIVYHFTGSMAQSVAGLFHDISTPVFAHVVDFLHGDYLNQESTEEETKRIIHESIEIQEKLKKWNIKEEEVWDYHIYPIADNDTPKLSADRLEYTLGNFLNYGFGSVEDIRAFYKDLIVKENEEGVPELQFQSESLAKDFSLRVIKNSIIYSQDEDRYAMEALARILKKAISLNVLEEKDLYQTEPYVISKMIQNETLKKEWEWFTHLYEVETSKEEKSEGDWYKMDAKKRYINPLVNGKRVHDFSEEVKEKMDEFVGLSYDYWVFGKSSKPK